MTDIPIDSLIKIYYNISLMIRMKNDIYQDIIAESEITHAPSLEMDMKLIASDLEQLKRCKTSLEGLLEEQFSKSSNKPKITTEEKINQLIMLDPYYILMNDVKDDMILEENLLELTLFKTANDKRYIN